MLPTCNTNQSREVFTHINRISLRSRVNPSAQENIEPVKYTNYGLNDLTVQKN